MLHRVVVPFPCSWDGITLVDLSIGDERDFGPMANGLMGMGWIEPIEKGTIEVTEEFAVAAELPMEMAAADEPIETATARRPRKRK